MHIALAPVKDCRNIDSYGMICVECNQCGRFDDILKKQQAEPYCKLHRVKLIFVRKEYGVEIYYCPKCRKEYTEFPDISPIYWSNYEHIYEEVE